MRKVRVLKAPPVSEIRVLGLEEWGGAKAEEDARILQYKHRLGDVWFQRLLEELSLEGKRLNPGRARRLIVAALLKGEPVDGD